jgi:hypothetical protein
MRRMMLPKVRHGDYAVHELLNHDNDLTRAWGVFTVGKRGVTTGIEICVRELPTLDAASKWALSASRI